MKKLMVSRSDVRDMAAALKGFKRIHIDPLTGSWGVHSDYKFDLYGNITVSWLPYEGHAMIYRTDTAKEPLYSTKSGQRDDFAECGEQDVLRFALRILSGLATQGARELLEEELPPAGG
jgi:hypothetical protein